MWLRLVLSMTEALGTMMIYLVESFTQTTKSRCHTFANFVRLVPKISWKDFCLFTLSCLGYCLEIQQEL